MVWKVLLVFLVVVVLKIQFNRARQISVKNAREKLENDAILIDVRTASEFASGHLPRAINMPLSDFDATLARRVKDKDQVLLLHCQSGMRSGSAMKKAKTLGYMNSFNVGSYGRAEQIVKSS